MERPVVCHIDLGLMSYTEALKVQEKIHALTVKQIIGGAFITVQHPDVLTLGKNATSQHVLAPLALLQERNIDLVRVERGGEITAHSPGQLVIYPILPLSRAAGGLPFGPHAYVAALEQSVITLLADYGITANKDPQYPGVWVGERKICAIGVRVLQRVSLHGLALNINNDLGIFSLIVPCGIAHRKTTSLRELTGKNIDLTFLSSRLLAILAKNLGVNDVSITYDSVASVLASLTQATL